MVIIALIAELLLFSYFLFVTIYVLLPALAGLFSPKYPVQHAPSKHRMAVFIPAYKEDDVILESVKQNLKLNYPSDRLKWVVVADSLKEETLRELASLPVQVVRVDFVQSTKVKALNAAFRHLEEEYDLCVVLDADNIADQEFLNFINKYFSSGYRAIQGQRKPKNTDTKMAFLDGLSEAINNHLVRKGTCVLGGSSAIVGSGFAVEFKLMKEILAGMDSVGGFDKELEVKLLKQGVKTIYVEDAVVFDEKVPNREVFKKQRQRWIASQFFYLRKYFKGSLQALFRGEFALFNSAFLRYAQLPRFLNLGFFFLLLVVMFFLRGSLVIPYWFYVSLFLVFLGSIFLSIPREYYSRKLLNAGLELPLTFFNMFLLLFRLKGANRKFVHTPHGKK